MAGEPPLDPPDYPELPEPCDDEWVAWRMGKIDEFWEWILEEKQDEVIEAIEHVLIPFLPPPMGKGCMCSDESKLKSGQALVDLIEEFIQAGDLNDFHNENPPKEPDCDGPPDRPDDDCPQFYDGTGKY